MAEVVVDVVVPELGIFAVFAGEADGVEDVTGTGVVGGKDELDALLGIGDVGGEVAVKVAEVGGADVEVAVGAEVVVNVEMVGSLRHDLHEAVGSESGFGVLVEMGFAIDDGCNEAPIPAEGTACRKASLPRATVYPARSKESYKSAPSSETAFNTRAPP